MKSNLYRNILADCKHSGNLCRGLDSKKLSGVYHIGTTANVAVFLIVPRTPTA